MNPQIGHEAAMIHPTSIISSKAQLADSVRIGPFCTVGDNVTLGEGCILDSHVVIEGPSTIGAGNRFFPFCVIGAQPQDLKFTGEETFLVIGSHNVFREYVNIHRGTRGGGGRTRIGDHNFLMTGVHVAHDCIIGDHIIMANAATLAGHVVIEDHATIGAYSGVHQYCRVGRHGYVGGYTVVTKDVLPYSKTVSDRNTKAYGVNAIGLERKGFSSEQITAIKAAFRFLLQSNLNTTQAVAAIKEAGLGPDADVIVRFIETSNRGVVK